MLPFSLLMVFAVSPALLPASEPPVREATEEAPATETRETVFSKAAPESIEDLQNIQLRVEELVKKVTPSTVGLRIGRAQGSGVIVTKDGYVLTAAHVSGKPGRAVAVTLHDGREVIGKTLGANSAIDAGLVKITSKGEWTPMEMGSVDNVKLGDWCIATGHPGGYLKGRPPVLRLGRIVLKRDSVLQTDCTLVGGDSGGPLFDMDGKVIGIHSRIGPSTSWNFHVPIAAYSDDWDRLVAAESWGGTPGGGGAILGVSGEDHPQGCRVTNVADGFPAKKAGILEGDIIVSLDGEPISGFNSLASEVRENEPGDKVRIKVLRDGEELTFEAVLARR